MRVKVIETIHNCWESQSAFVLDILGGCFQVSSSEESRKMIPEAYPRDPCRIPCSGVFWPESHDVWNPNECQVTSRENNFPGRSQHPS